MVSPSLIAKHGSWSNPWPYGKPNKEQLLEFMNDAYEKRVRHMDHSHTEQMVSKENVSQQFFNDVIGKENDETGEDST